MISSFPALPTTFDGQTVQDIENGIFLVIVSGLYDGVKVRGQDVTVPYLDGQISRKRRRHERLITLAGHVRGVGDTEADRQMAYANQRAAWEDAGGLFDLARDAAELRVAHPDGSESYIDCRPVTVTAVVQIPEEFADYTVQLLSVVPDWTRDLDPEG